EQVVGIAGSEIPGEVAGFRFRLPFIEPAGWARCVRVRVDVEAHRAMPIDDHLGRLVDREPGQLPEVRDKRVGTRGDRVAPLRLVAWIVPALGILPGEELE